MPAEPHIRSPFSERLAPQSLILEVIGLGRAGPHCMAAYHSHCLRRSARPDPTGLIRPRGTRDNDPAFLGGSVWLHDSTRRDLTMVDISREGDEQFPGERDNRDAADPAAFGANALAVRPRSEPTRWRNQQLRALSGWYLTHIQASSTIVVRRRGFPAFEIPCSWSMLPLFHGLGARPA